jgi:hypothetical protein
MEGVAMTPEVLQNQATLTFSVSTTMSETRTLYGSQKGSRLSILRAKFVIKLQGLKSSKETLADSRNRTLGHTCRKPATYPTELFDQYILRLHPSLPLRQLTRPGGGSKRISREGILS